MLRIKAKKVDLKIYDCSGSQEYIPLRSLTQLNEALKNREIKQILNDPDFFYLAFCKVFLPKQEMLGDFFRVSVVDDKARMQGSHRSQVMSCVETLRKLLVANWERKENCSIALVKKLNFYLWIPEAEVLDVSELFEGMDDSGFDQYIKPVVADLAALIEANLIILKKNMPVLQESYSMPSVEKVELFRFEWNCNDRRIYPIAPKPLPEKKDVDQAFYQLYQKQEYCDFRLITFKGEVKVHSQMLYLNGGSVLQALLKSSMHETVDKEIKFEYSLGTIQSLVDYVYLGAKELLKKIVDSSNKSEIDLLELLNFAHTYQIDGLVDCAVHLYYLYSSPHDVDTIRSLALIYDNEQLKKLADHFTLIKQGIKV